MIWVLYVVLGIAAGVLSGMGIGGGALLIPALVMLFGMSQQQAQNVNLIYFIPTAAIALITHLKAGRIEKSIIKKFLIPGLLAAVIGSLIALQMDSEVLRRIFGGFLLIMGISELRKGRKSKDMENNDFTQMKERFKASDVDGKVEIYVEARGLSQDQYKELLMLFPYGELYKLEEALA